MSETYNVWLKQLNLLVMKSLNVFFSETAEPVFTRFHMGPSVEGVFTN